MRFLRWVWAKDYPPVISRLRFFIVLFSIVALPITYFTILELRVAYVLDSNATHVTGRVDDVKSAISGKGFVHYCDVTVAASFIAESDGRRYVVGASRNVGSPYYTKVGRCGPSIFIHRGDPIPVDYAAPDPRINRIVWGESQSPDPEMIFATFLLWLLLFGAVTWNWSSTPITH